MKNHRLGILGAIPLLVLLSTSPSALAHAMPTEEQPMAGATVATPPKEVTIEYDSPIEKLFAKLNVLDANGKDLATDKPTVGAKRRSLSVQLPPLPDGTYTVKWSVVAEDGHRTQGSYTFTIAAGSK